MTPYPYLHLSYPEILEQVVVCQAQRVRVDLICSDSKLGESGDTLDVISRLTVGALEEQYISTHAIVRSVSEIPESENSQLGRFRLGVEFEQPSQEVSLLLHGYVYEQIVKNRHA